VASLQDQGTAEFTPAEKAVLAFAEEMTRPPGEVSPATFEELRKHWNERQVVEIATVAALFNFTNRWNNALGVDLTVYPASLAEKPGGGCA